MHARLVLGDAAWACRVFKCERGLRQHVHMVHTLAAVTATARPRYRCGACGATSASRRGAQLHAAECGQAKIIYVRSGDGAAAAGRGDAPIEAGHGEDAALDEAAADSNGAARPLGGSAGQSPRPPGAPERDRGGSGEQAGVDTSGHRGADEVHGRKERRMAVAAAAAECRICGLGFTCAADERAHHAWLRPREEVHRCGGCGRKFGDGRALRQHTAACGAGAGGTMAAGEAARASVA